MNIQVLSKHLSLRGIDHIVVAAPLAPVGGRERFQKLIIKQDRNGACSGIWFDFLRKFGIKTVPEKLSGFHAGAFSYQYSNPSHSICIWTQERPDQNPLRPGYAGVSVLRVEDNAPHKFGKIRSALVQISNIPPTRKRMTKEELRGLVTQLQAQPNAVDTTDIEDEIAEHDSALDALDDSEFSDFADFGRAYNDKRSSSKTSKR